MQRCAAQSSDRATVDEEVVVLAWVRVDHPRRPFNRVAVQAQLQGMGMGMTGVVLREQVMAEEAERSEHQDQPPTG